MTRASVVLVLTGCLENPAFIENAGTEPTAGATTTDEPTTTDALTDGGSCDVPGGPDSDQDGTPDACDPCVYDAYDDADGDGLCADMDPCPASPESDDVDGDGVAAACDPCPLDPADDQDGDGVCDGVDLCPGSNDDQDGDGNGVPDGCESCPGADEDGDGACDTVDQCPGHDDSVDADGDGLPDGCDECEDDPKNDPDDDGACEGADNCPGVMNPAQNDGDGDGHGDACDVCKHPDYSDDDADYDDDGIPCAQDPCLHDGPRPPSFPDEVGPHQEITLSGASIDGGGSFASVGPGADFELYYEWFVNFCECQDCITQGLVGLDGIPPAKCFYNSGSQDNCEDQNGETTQVFKAPTQPGIYTFKVRRTWEYECLPNVDLDPDSAFAAICVK